REGVLEPIGRDLPILGEIGDQAELLIELYEAGEENWQHGAGYQALRNLAGVQRHGLADLEADAVGPSLLRLLRSAARARGPRAPRRMGVHRSEALREPKGAGRRGQLHQGATGHAGTTQDTPVDR